MPENALYYGDNLDILRRHVPDESVDLVYLDPPFNSNANYNVLFKEASGELSPAQLQAFSDTWHWDRTAEAAYRQIAEQQLSQVSRMIGALLDFIGRNDMMAYLVMMTPRLVELRRALKPSGSIYLHCDPTASHYLKVVMDVIFGKRSFRNEVVWRRTGSHNSSRRFGPIHDTLLFYTKSDQYQFNRAYRPYLKGHVDSYFRQQDAVGRRYWTNALTGAGTRKGESGQPWRGYNPTVVGRHWAIPGRVVEELGIDPALSTHEKLDALDEAGFVAHPQSGSSGAMPTYFQYLDASPGLPIQDIWAYQPHTRGSLWGSEDGIDEDVRWLVAQGDKERLGYQTQKPLGLLERVITSSCPPGGLVLDPFCGCGTAVVAAHHLKRSWIGIDLTHLAITVMKNRLADSFGLVPGEGYRVVGEPVDLGGARALAAQDRYQFQWWAVSLVSASPVEKKKGADAGIDGVMTFVDDKGKTKTILVSVKSGAVTVSMVRDLRGAMEREKAELGLFITLEMPTKPMQDEAVSAGYYHSEVWKADFPRLQIATIQDLLSGERPPLPRSAVRGFAQAQHLGERAVQGQLIPRTGFL